jgi:hypothetical protein
MGKQTLIFVYGRSSVTSHSLGIHSSLFKGDTRSTSATMRSWNSVTLVFIEKSRKETGFLHGNLDLYSDRTSILDLNSLHTRRILIDFKTKMN